MSCSDISAMAFGSIELKLIPDGYTCLYGLDKYYLFYLWFYIQGH